MHPLDRLIIALDVPSQAEALSLVERLDGAVRWVKVGLELFIAEGPGVVEALLARDLRVFLDLKLHDIPNTVAAAVRVAGATGAQMLTVHASGGPAMLRAAAEAAPAGLHLLGVTVLTSMDEGELSATGVAGAVGPQVKRLAQLAMAAGVPGLVCSSQEIGLLRSDPARAARLVVPGIRPAGYGADDQSRTATAADAIRMGADMLVVGRPVTRAANPAEAARALLKEIEQESAE